MLAAIDSYLPLLIDSILVISTLHSNDFDGNLDVRCVMVGRLLTAMKHSLYMICLSQALPTFLRIHWRTHHTQSKMARLMIFVSKGRLPRCERACTRRRPRKHLEGAAVPRTANADMLRPWKYSMTGRSPWKSVDVVAMSIVPLRLSS